MTTHKTKHTFWVVWDTKNNTYLQHNNTFGVDTGARRFANPEAALGARIKLHHQAVEVEMEVRHLRIATVKIDAV